MPNEQNSLSKLSGIRLRVVEKIMRPSFLILRISVVTGIVSVLICGFIYLNAVASIRAEFETEKAQSSKVREATVSSANNALAAAVGKLKSTTDKVSGLKRQNAKLSKQVLNAQRSVAELETKLARYQ
jgi:hypothetical protein